MNHRSARTTAAGPFASQPTPPALMDTQYPDLVSAIDATIDARRRAGDNRRDAVEQIAEDLALHLGRLTGYLALSERDLFNRNARLGTLTHSAARVTYHGEVQRAVATATAPARPRRLR